MSHGIGITIFRRNSLILFQAVTSGNGKLRIDYRGGKELSYIYSVYCVREPPISCGRAIRMAKITQVTVWIQGEATGSARAILNLHRRRKQRSY